MMQKKILLLSGAPFRSDNIPISFVNYDENKVCIADFHYSFSNGWKDKIIREVIFKKDPI